MKDWLQVKKEGGLFFVSHSGGKDSQAMYNYILNNLEIPTNQIIVVHAHLGRIEWEGVADHITENTRHELNIVQAVTKDGEKNDFLTMVKKRGMWPSPKYRQCTSDLKRGPIYKFIRKTMKERSIKLAVNCTGMRAQESSARSKKKDWAVNNELSKAGREVYEFLPIHSWTTEEVFDNIYMNGQKPFWAYGERGELNERLSCVFCIMGSINDHRNGAEQRPELFKELVQMEKAMGHTMFQGETLEERNGINAAELTLVNESADNYNENTRQRPALTKELPQIEKNTCQTILPGNVANLSFDEFQNILLREVALTYQTPIELLIQPIRCEPRNNNLIGPNCSY